MILSALFRILPTVCRVVYRVLSIGAQLKMEIRD